MADMKKMKLLKEALRSETPEMNGDVHDLDVRPARSLSSILVFGRREIADK